MLIFAVKIFQDFIIALIKIERFFPDKIYVLWVCKVSYSRMICKISWELYLKSWIDCIYQAYKHDKYVHNLLIIILWWKLQHN